MQAQVRTVVVSDIPFLIGCQISFDPLVLVEILPLCCFRHAGLSNAVVLHGTLEGLQRRFRR